MLFLPNTVRGGVVEIIPPTSTGTTIGFQIVAGVYQVGNYTSSAYEYFRYVNTAATFQDLSNIKVFTVTEDMSWELYTWMILIEHQLLKLVQTIL